MVARDVQRRHDKTSRSTTRGRRAGRSRAPAPAPKPSLPTYTGPYDPLGPDRDCGDFRTHADAQAFFIAAGGPTSDRHRLDADHDGIACEALR